MDVKLLPMMQREPRYPLLFTDATLKAKMKKLAKQNGRSLNAEINQALKQYAAQGKK